jgi:hypothetical protein
MFQNTFIKSLKLPGATRTPGDVRMAIANHAGTDAAFASGTVQWAPDLHLV